MATSPGSEPIDDDELLYRRVPVLLNLYDPSATVPLLPDAFRPNANDRTGLSIHRAKYKSIQEAGQGRPGKQYYVAVLRAGDLRARGIQLAPRPLVGDPGHAEIVGLTYQDRKLDQVLEWKFVLANELCLRVEGPYPATQAVDPCFSANSSPPTSDL
jgi:hypothetical protein